MHICSRVSEFLGGYSYRRGDARKSSVGHVGAGFLSFRRINWRKQSAVANGFVCFYCFRYCLVWYPSEGSQVFKALGCSGRMALWTEVAYYKQPRELPKQLKRGPFG